jgi:hypothetical protein
MLADLARSLASLIRGVVDSYPKLYCSNSPAIPINASLRAPVIAEWRGLPTRKLQPQSWQSPAALMPRLMQCLGLSERLRETEIIDAWSKIVGDFIAAHFAPVELREGILMSGSWNARCTTNSKKSPSLKSCEN